MYNLLDTYFYTSYIFFTLVVKKDVLLINTIVYFEGKQRSGLNVHKELLFNSYLYI